MVRSRSRSTGRKGEGWRRSCHTSALRLATAVTPSARLSAEVSAKRWPTEVNQKSALTAPMAKRIWPATSAFVAGRSCAMPRGSRKRRHAANAASGRLAKNSQRQLTCDTTMPPSTGPPMLAAVNTVAK